MRRTLLFLSAGLLALAAIPLRAPAGEVLVDAQEFQAAENMWKGVAATNEILSAQNRELRKQIEQLRIAANKNNGLGPRLGEIGKLLDEMLANPTIHWTLKDGKRMVARLVKDDGVKLTVKTQDGKPATIARADLADEDVQFLDRLKVYKERKAAEPPPAAAPASGPPAVPDFSKPAEGGAL